jgi:hypothetical protein
MSEQNEQQGGPRAPAVIEHMVLQIRRKTPEAATSLTFTAGRWEVHVAADDVRSVRLTLAFLRDGGQWWLQEPVLVVDGEPVDVGDDLARALRILNGGDHLVEDTTRRTRRQPAAQGGLTSVGVRRHAVIRN